MCLLFVTLFVCLIAEPRHVGFGYGWACFAFVFWVDLKYRFVVLVELMVLLFCVLMI